MPDSNHELPTSQREMTTSAPSGASWRFGHSPAGGASEPAPAPGVAGSVRRQGAPDGKAATEGGPQPSMASRKGKARRGSRARATGSSAPLTASASTNRNSPSSSPAPTTSA